MEADETSDSRQKALDIARHTLHMLATVVPSAKQQSFAAHNLADFAIVSFADQPISLENAFEKPVARDRQGGYLTPSISELVAYWSRVNHAHGLKEQARAFALADGVTLGESAPWTSLTQLEEWIAMDAQD